MPVTRIALLLYLAGNPLIAQNRRALADSIAESIDRLSRRAIAEGVSPALGVAVAMDGEVVFRAAYGMADATRGVPATPQSLWYVASTSKSFTGFAMSLLSSRGALRFSDRIGTLLPTVVWPTATHADTLPLAAFLSHTHGLNDAAVVMSAAFTAAVPEAQWPTLIRLTTPLPAAGLVYSNFGYNIAAMVIDRVHALGWRDFLETEVYRPAGLQNTFTALSHVDAGRLALPHRRAVRGGYQTDGFAKTDATMNSAGGHVATLDDLARWTLVQMDSGRIDGRQVFPKEAVAIGQQLIARQTRDAARRFGPFDRDGWGAGWDIGSYRGERMISRFGGYASLRSHLSFLPARRVGVVAMSTGGSGGAFTDIVAALVYDLEAGRPDATSVANMKLEELATRERSARLDETRRAGTGATRGPRVPPHALASHLGSYAADGFGTVVVTRRDDQLLLTWGIVAGELAASDDSGRLSVDLGGTSFSVQFGDPVNGHAPHIVINGIRLPRR
jgi:CubicO group peptidase (beta-lactamase class C family)